MRIGMEKKFLHGLKWVSRCIIMCLMLVLVLSMLLGTADLFIIFIKNISTPDPYAFLINVEDLYKIFSVLLIIVVGYELLKSMQLILSSDKIPVRSILKIASIALANKIITLNLKEVEMSEMLGLAALIIAMSAAFFFYSKEAEATENNQ